MKQEIKIGKNSYPAFQTMGAILAFSRETGMELTTISSGDLVSLLKYLYCVVRSACKREEVDFPFDSVDDFADGLALDDFTDWASGLNEPASPAADVKKQKTKNEEAGESGK